MTQTTQLDVAGVIKKFGGRAQLYRKLCLAKIQISHRTLDNWIYHGIIPMHRFLQLMDIAKAEGINLNLHNFIINTKTNTKNEKTRTDDTARTGKGDREPSVAPAGVSAESSTR